MRERFEALERLEAILLPMQDREPSQRPEELISRIEAIRADLEAANNALYGSVRERIRRGEGRAAMLEWAGPTDTAGGTGKVPDRGGYDYLDALVNGVLHFAPIEADVPDIRPEMVAYQPTPARHIFAMIRRTAPDAGDVFVDIGSGLGHVPMVVSICTGVQSIGIEIEPLYVECARRTAAALNLGSVTFVQADARDADLSEGTIFYLYSPCIGGMLKTLLDRLRHEAERRDVRVCTLGPCVHDMAREEWLVSEGAVSPERPTVFRRRRNGGKVR